MPKFKWDDAVESTINHINKIGAEIIFDIC